MSAPTRQRKPLGVRRTLSDLAFVFELRPCANRGENSGRFTNDIARSRRRWRPRPGHIGVIQWLTENGYDIRSIAGSSMGALVGGIYATSKLEVYTEWVSALERMQVVRLLDPAFGRTGLFKGE